MLAYNLSRNEYGMIIFGVGVDIGVVWGDVRASVIVRAVEVVEEEEVVVFFIGVAAAAVEVS